MTEDLSHSEIQELLGAFALDAVDEHERTIIDAHLETCESCRLELTDHRRLAETLRRHAIRVSPLASTESNGSPRSDAEITHPRRVGRWAVPSVLAVMALLLGGLFSWGQIRLDHLAATTDHIELLERAQLAAGDPSAVVTTLRTARNEPVLTVVSRAGGGTSYAMNGALPRIADGQIYQLWRDQHGVVTAAVALGRPPDAAEFALPPGMTELVLTIEKSPTPSRPTFPAIATGRITT